MKKYLIGQLACFGDCLYATTIAKQIKNDYPESHVTWAVAAKYKSILKLNPYVDAIWEVEFKEDDNNLTAWRKFKKEALQRKHNGEFDEIIFSQIAPDNWINFNGTIRGTILSSYKKPITVSVEPVVKLSNDEIENVKLYAEKNKLHSFKNVILFECSPGSRQSTLNIEFALEVCNTITATNKDACFILSSHKKNDFIHPQIIDASELSYRENAALTHYCTLLIGCSSGITWLSTSDSAKRLPMLQLLSGAQPTFAGVKYDFKLNGLDNSKIIEIAKFDKPKVVNAIKILLTGDFEKAKKLFDQDYKPSYFNFEAVVRILVNEHKSLPAILRFAKNYVSKSKEANNPLRLNYGTFFLKLLVMKLRTMQRLKVPAVMWLYKKLNKTEIAVKHTM